MLARDVTPGAANPKKLPEPTKRALKTQPGSPIPNVAKYATTFGVDVSFARVVTGPAAEEAAAAVSARAFAVGNRVFLGAGQSATDEKLMAHELTHVVQQRNATISSFDDLPITTPEDAVEHEARQVADGSKASGTTADAAIARDATPGVTATEWLSQYAPYVVIDLTQRLYSLELQLASPYLAWNGSAKGFLLKGFAFKSGELINQLSPLLGGEKRLLQIVDKGRLLETDDSGNVTDKGPNFVTLNVGVEIYNELLKLILPSFARVAPRYCSARMQAKLVEEKAKTATLLDAPEPSPDDVTPSHPVDLRMRDCFCNGKLKFDWNKYVTDNPGQGTIKQKPRHLSLTVAEVGPNFFWVTAFSLNPEPITAEDVCEKLYGSSLWATEIIVSGSKFGCDRAADLKQEYKTQLAGKGATKEFLEGKQSGGDPVQALLADPKQADQLALDQSKGFNGTGAQTPEILKRLGNSRTIMDDIIARAQKLGLADALAAARDQIVRKEGELKTATDADVMKWDVPSARQADVLRAVTGGLQACVGYWTNLVDTATDPKGEKLAPDAREPILEVAGGLVRAGAQSALPDIASQTLATVNPKLQSLPFDLMESLVRGIERTLAQVSKSDTGKAYKPEELASKKDLLRRKISVKREEVLKHPERVQQIVEELFDEVGDLSTDTQLAAKLDSLDQTFNWLEDKSVWDDIDDRLKMFGAKQKIDKRRKEFQPIYADWKASRDDKSDDGKKKKQDAKARLKSLLEDPAYRKDLEDARTTINEVAHDRAVAKMIATVIAMIAITIVSMGIGTAIGAGVTTALAGSVAAGTMAAGTATVIAGGAAVLTEAVVFTALNTFFMEDPSWENIGKELVFNIVTFGAMKGISKAYRGAEAVKAAFDTGGKLAKGAATAGELTIQMITMQAAANAHEMMYGKELTAEQQKDIFAQSLGMFIAMAVAGRAAAPLFKELQAAGVEVGLRNQVTKMNAEREILFRAAMEASHETKNPAGKIKELLAQEKKVLDTQRKTLELIASNEKLLTMAGISEPLAKQMATDAGNAAYQIKVGEALETHAKPMAQGHYTTTKAGLAEIKKAFGQETPGVPIQEFGQPEALTWEFTPPAGKGQSIRVTIGEIKATETKVDASATPKNAPTTPTEPPNLDGVPDKHKDEARWQSQDIPADQWGKSASDGTTYKEAYQKWQKQAEPYKHGPNGVEPVRPEGLSDAAWAEFKPKFQQALNQQKIVIKGAEIVETLKQKGIDPAKADPESPQYQSIRPELIKELGAEVVKNFEASLTLKQNDPAAAKLNAAAHTVVTDAGLATLRETFSDCQVLLTGGTTRPPEALATVKHVDAIIIAPDGVGPEIRIGIEERANSLTIEAGEGIKKAGGPDKLPVKAKVMTKEQYLGIKAADPKAPADLRIDTNFKKATPDDVAAGYDAAAPKNSLNNKGELPKDVSDLLTKGLPGASIDPHNPQPGIEAYVNAKSGGKKLTVTQTGERQFVIKDGDKTVGTFTIYENPTEMGRELAALKKVKELKLTSLEVAGATEAATIEGTKQTAVTAEPLKGELVKDALGKAATKSGDARIEAVKQLQHDATDTAKALAELHNNAASGEKVGKTAKENEIDDLETTWTKAKQARANNKSSLTETDVQEIEAKLKKLKTAFRKADLDATMALGNADVATTGVQQGGKVAVDGSALKGSVGKDGKVNGIGGEDVGRYLESMRAAGTDAGLSPVELARIEKTFLETYKSNLKSGGSGVDTAIEFYKTKRALEGVVEASKEAKGASNKDAAGAKVRDRVQSLRNDLGLSSAFNLPPDALTLDPARLERFREWMGDPKTKLSADPKQHEQYLARLRDYFASDPKGALELARKHYGFEKQLGPVAPDPAATPDSELVTGDATADAKRMLEYLENADPAFKKGKKLSPSQIDAFIKAYESGKRFDAVTRKWYVPGEVGKTKLVFESSKNYTPKDVFDILSGTKQIDPPADAPPGQPVQKISGGFKAWAEMVGKLKHKGKVIADRATLEKTISEVGYADEDVDVVRHDVKSKFKDAINESLANPTAAELQADPQYQGAEFDWKGDPKGAQEKARFLRMRRAVEGLDPSDRGNIVEVWRDKTEGINDPTNKHIVVKPETAPDMGVDPLTNEKVKLDNANVLDSVEVNGTKIYDNKDYSGALGPKNEPQLNEQLKLAGKFKGSAVELEVPVKDKNNKPTGETKKLHIDGVRWGVSDPRGVELSAEWMAEMLTKHPDNLEFEIRNWKGERKIVGVNDAGFLENPKALSAWLGAKPSGF